MSVEQELIKLQTNLTNSYTACENKGATIPAEPDFNSLAATIATIPAGGNIESLSITPTTSQQVIEASGNVDGYAPITVAAVTSAIDQNILAGNIKSGVTILGVNGSVIEKNTTTLSITPTTSAQTLTPQSPYNGFEEVSVSAVTSAIDNNILAGNIKSGVTILGVTGTYEGVVGNIPRTVESHIYRSPRDQDFYTFSLSSEATDLDDFALAYAFYSSSDGALTSLDLSSLTQISFNNCLDHACVNNTSLTTVNFSNLQTISGNEVFNGAFDNCISLTSISFPALETVSGHRVFKSAFPNNVVESLSFPSLTTVSGDYAFNYILYTADTAGSLTNLDLSALETVSGAYAFDGAFYSCPDLTSLDLSSLTTVSGSCAFRGAFATTGLSTITLTSLASVTGYGAFQKAFNECTSLTSIPFTELTSVSGQYAFNEAFSGCYNLKIVSFPKLTTVSGKGAFQNAFSTENGGSAVTSISFPSLTTVSGDHAFDQICYVISSGGALTNLDLSALETVSGQYAFNEAFTGNIDVRMTVDLSSLTTVSGAYAFKRMFDDTTTLEEIAFPSLTTISGNYAFQEAFNWYDGTDINFPLLSSITGKQVFDNCFQHFEGNIAFPSLTTNSFGSWTNQFDNIAGDGNVTLHFPSNLQTLISSFPEYPTFGGGVSSVLFDLPATE